MISSCIICGSSVVVTGNPEIVVCQSDQCIKTVEDHISIHYVTESVVLSRHVVNRNDFEADMLGQYRRV